MELIVGAVWRHSAFYLSRETGELKPKYFVLLAVPPNDDVVVRLLTSRYEGVRPRTPPCFHGDPYPGFYIGTAGGVLSKPTWIDLRACGDLDRWQLARDESRGLIEPIMQIDNVLLRAAMACTASSSDVTLRQERLIRDALAQLPG